MVIAVEEEGECLFVHSNHEILWFSNEPLPFVLLNLCNLEHGRKGSAVVMRTFYLEIAHWALACQVPY